MRFSIRDVLWLTVLAAVLVAWWIDRRAAKLAAERNAAEMVALRAELKSMSSIVRLFQVRTLASPRPRPDEWDLQVPPHFERIQRSGSSLELRVRSSEALD